MHAHGPLELALALCLGMLFWRHHPSCSWTQNSTGSEILHHLSFGVKATTPMLTEKWFSQKIGFLGLEGKAYAHATHPAQMFAKSLLPTDYWERHNPLNPFPHSRIEFLRTGQWRFMIHVDFMCDMSLLHWLKTICKLIIKENIL